MSELVALDIDGARRLTERIRLIAANVADNVEKLRALVAEAKEGNVHELLGYPSWTAYLKDVFGDEPLRLARDVRQELVAELAAQGMSTRAIAPIVGTSHMQVANDIHETGVKNFTTDSVVVIHVNAETGEVADEPPREIAGLDGKAYTAPAKREVRRPSIIDSARTAGWELRKAIERLERLKADDRYAKNKAEIMAALQPHLDFANETIAGL